MALVAAIPAWHLIKFSANRRAKQLYYLLPWTWIWFCFFCCVAVFLVRGEVPNEVMLRMISIVHVLLEHKQYWPCGQRTEGRWQRAYLKLGSSRLRSALVIWFRLNNNIVIPVVLFTYGVVSDLRFKVIQHANATSAFTPHSYTLHTTFHNHNHRHDHNHGKQHIYT